MYFTSNLIYNAELHGEGAANDKNKKFYNSFVYVCFVFSAAVRCQDVVVRPSLTLRLTVL